MSLSVQSTGVDKHLAVSQENDIGRIESLVVLADVTYGLTDRIAVDFAVPFVASRYLGTFPHDGSNLDDQTWHSTISDVRFALRYNATRGRAVITPYVGTMVPSHDYVYSAHAAPGMQLREIQVGAYVGHLFESVPGLFVSGRYSYGFLEKVQDISHNRSSADLEVGYFVSPGLRVFGMTSGQYTHGGVDFPTSGGLRALPLPYQPVHDVIQRVHALKAGGGAAYSLTDSIDVFGSVATQVAGRNGHKLQYRHRARGVLGVHAEGTAGRERSARQRRSRAQAAAQRRQAGTDAPSVHLPEGARLAAGCSGLAGHRPGRRGRLGQAERQQQRPEPHVGPVGDRRRAVDATVVDEGAVLAAAVLDRRARIGDDDPGVPP